MAAFGIPLDDLFGRRAKRIRRGTETVDVYGTQIPADEWDTFVIRWVRYNRQIAEGGKDVDSTLKRQYVMIQEAQRAGLVVSDEEVRKAASKHGWLRQYLFAEVLAAKNEPFAKKVEVKADEVKAYYDEHKDDYKLPAEEGKEAQYKEFEKVRDEIEKTLAAKKAEKLIDDALASARTAAEKGGEEGAKSLRIHPTRSASTARCSGCTTTRTTSRSTSARR